MFGFSKHLKLGRLGYIHMDEQEARGINIVFVDSLQHETFAMQRLLKRFFADVDVCDSLEDAVCLSGRKNIHIIIENLPIILEYGKDIVARIRNTVPAEIPALVISALRVDDNPEKADKIKILEIPIRAEELISSIYELTAV